MWRKPALPRTRATSAKVVGRDEDHIMGEVASAALARRLGKLTSLVALVLRRH